MQYSPLAVERKVLGFGVNLMFDTQYLKSFSISALPSNIGFAAKKKQDQSVRLAYGFH